MAKLLDAPEELSVLTTIATLYDHDRRRMVTDNAARMHVIRRLCSLGWNGQRAHTAVQYVIDNSADIQRYL